MRRNLMLSLAGALIAPLVFATLVGGLPKTVPACSPPFVRSGVDCREQQQQDSERPHSHPRRASS